MRASHAVTLLALLLLATPTSAVAQSYPPLTNENFQLDLHQGPILGSTRVIGMGGAFVGVAEGTEAIPFNPAAVANRPYYSTESFDWSWAFDFLLPNGIPLDDFDFDNSGRGSRADRFPVFVLGAHFQIDEFGIGLYFTSSTTSIVEAEPSSRSYEITLLDAYLAAGYALFDHQLVVGAGLRVGSLSLSFSGSSDELFSTTFIGLLASALWRPKRLPIRVGASFSIPFDSSVGQECGDQCPNGFFLPREVTLPWELRVGASWFLLADKPYNRAPQLYGRPASKPKKPDMDRDYRGGRYLLVSAELAIIGPDKNASASTRCEPRSSSRSENRWRYRRAWGSKAKSGGAACACEPARITSRAATRRSMVACTALFPSCCDCSTFRSGVIARSPLRPVSTSQNVI
jgi:hypothetical protein